MMTGSGSAAFDYSDRPAVLVFADGGGRQAAIADDVVALGGRVSACLPIAAALDRLDNQSALAAVIIELDEDGGSDLDALLERIDQNAWRSRHSSVVIMPPRLIDVAAARITATGVTLLCDPDPTERVAAIGATLLRPAHRLGDVSTDHNGGGARLKELSEEVARIARALASMAADDQPRANGANGTGSANGVAAHTHSESAPAQVDAGQIRTLIRARRLRSQYFPSELFADPAWDMLLDLTAARLEGRAVAVSSLCIASAVPPTTALRWIKTLTDGKLFARVADSTDGRRIFIELTDDAAAGMIAYLSALHRLITVRT